MVNLRTPFFFAAAAFLMGTSGPVRAETLKMGIAMPAPSPQVHALWKPTAEYLSSQLGQVVEIVTPRGLTAIKKDIKQKKFDILYINSYAYYLLKQDGMLRAFAQMENAEGTIYSVGRIIVRSDSTFSSIKDLKGKQIALISKLGAGAYLAPRAYFARHKINIENEMKLIYTWNLKKSVYSVLFGDSAAAVMCGVNYNILSRKLDTNDLRILDNTEKFPESVFAVRRGYPAEKLQRIQRVLIKMKNEHEGLQALGKLNQIKIGGFVSYDPAVESITQKMIQQGGL